MFVHVCLKLVLKQAINSSDNLSIQLNKYPHLLHVSKFLKSLSDLFSAKNPAPSISAGSQLLLSTKWSVDSALESRELLACNPVDHVDRGSVLYVQSILLQALENKNLSLLYSELQYFRLKNLCLAPPKWLTKNTVKNDPATISLAKKSHRR